MPFNYLLLSSHSCSNHHLCYVNEKGKQLDADFPRECHWIQLLGICELEVDDMNLSVKYSQILQKVKFLLRKIAYQMCACLFYMGPGEGNVAKIYLLNSCVLEMVQFLL